jgi:hypothetical protein
MRTCIHTSGGDAALISYQTRNLLPVMVGIKDWAEAHMDEVNAARRVYEARNAAAAAG